MSHRLDTVLKKIIQSDTYATQSELVDALREQGIAAKQSTVSRALTRIHAIKRMTPSGTVAYRLAPRGGGGLMGYTGLVSSVTHNGTMIVIKCKPGSASHVAQFIDEYADNAEKKVGVLGTIAGDNCIFIVPQMGTTIDHTTKILRQLLIV